MYQMCQLTSSSISGQFETFVKITHTPKHCRKKKHSEFTQHFLNSLVGVAVLLLLQQRLSLLRRHRLRLLRDQQQLCYILGLACGFSFSSSSRSSQLEGALKKTDDDDDENVALAGDTAAGRDVGDGRGVDGGRGGNPSGCGGSGGGGGGGDPRFLIQCGMANKTSPKMGSMPSEPSRPLTPQTLLDLDDISNG